MADRGIYDLLVIGGGINGAGIARDAAGRGLSVFLAEQGDLAEFTSSASTKLIHGGIRYLENYEFRLVREALMERERLLAIAPHIIWPLRFVLPHEPGLRPAWMIRIGLFLYDHLARLKTLPGSQGVNLRTSPVGMPLRDALTKGFLYSDCAVDDSRLVVFNAIAAEENGAQIRTRTRFVEAHREDDVWVATTEDLASGKRETVKARILINAAGPWVSELLSEKLGIHSRAAVRLVKGSHIVVPRLYEGEQAYIFQNPDRRIVFAIPYREKFTLIGTTDVPYEDEPHAVGISKDETAYLCESVNHYFKRGITPADVVWTYAGVRPLYDDAASNASVVTRDYVLDIDASSGEPPVMSIFGGKITTYRRLAEHALEKLEPWLPGLKPSWTAKVPLPGGDLPDGDFDRFVADLIKRKPFLPADMAHRLARAYGTHVDMILGEARALNDLGRDFGGGLTQAEVDYLVDYEWARTSADILWRRSKLGLVAPKETAAALDDYLDIKSTALRRKVN
ncbi:glycerol-3-phosphate dehydrogenase [Phyllobacterium leguminum]|uniref:Glycerol-3-phosphate dehydrogenase n=1 Tax=Phyllobacterium leguminum TaxID=314237 RepID=A0A318T910_9HYPH|nr:glycerol-3-phosphate dehydrogenase [Phyllobacterium leguminum]PYE87173.1 homodimeric glycerol 3-phosphate dehydrogenase (quinone) [Phyllobacterium leguminum]